MSQHITEILSGVYERWAKGDFRTADILDPHVLMVQRPGFPEAGTYLGPEGVAEYMRLFLEPWTRITIEAQEIIEVGDSAVVPVHQRAQGTQSGAATEFAYFHVWTFRGEKAIRLEVFRERGEALEAVGLSE